MINPIENKVLVLNRLWQPVHMCSAKRAIGLLSWSCSGRQYMFGEERFATYDFESWLGVEENIRGLASCGDSNLSVLSTLNYRSFIFLIACQEMRLNFPGTTFFREMNMYVSIAKKSLNRVT